MFSGGITNLLIFWNWMQKIRLAIQGVGVVTGPGAKMIVLLGKGIMGAKTAVLGMSAAMGWWLIAIAAVVAAGYLIYKNWG